MRVYVILGRHNTRKSSTIRALTGVTVCNVFNVALSSGKEISMLVCPQALQESKLKPRDFLNKVKEKNKKKSFDALLIALRVKGIKGCPDGIEYLKTFEDEKWEIVEPLILLGREKKDNLDKLKKYDGEPYQLYPIEEAPEMASNKIAAEIRGIWGWM